MTDVDVSEELLGRVVAALEAIRPFLQEDGGDVSLVRMRPDGVLELEWLGTCRICPMSVMTLRAGVERVLMKEVPEIDRVEMVARK
jgi:Fe-S cluster biogenesis protein NfuA